MTSARMTSTTLRHRGGWCPYCNMQLRAYQAVLPEMTALGARLVPQSVRASEPLSTAAANELTFDVLSDVGNSVARKFGLTNLTTQF
jgi:peroxiredoxin